MARTPGQVSEMGHKPQAFIAKGRPLVDTLTQAGVKRIDLRFRYVMVPLSEVWRILGHDADAPYGYPYEHLFVSNLVDQWARGISTVSPLAYVETDYFSGTGSQASIVWMHGEVDLGPRPYFGSLTTFRPLPINTALRRLGMWSFLMVDAFGLLSLG
jgi:hypothetical protein